MIYTYICEGEPYSFTGPLHAFVMQHSPFTIFCLQNAHLLGGLGECMSMEGSKGRMGVDVD